MIVSHRVKTAASAFTLVLVCAALPGCHGTGTKRVRAVEPGLTVPADGASTPVIEAPVSVPAGAPVSWIDRHPLFSKPREYYEKTDNNKAVKTAAAAVIGVPAGLVGEIKQIVTGNPAPVVSY